MNYVIEQNGVATQRIDDTAPVRFSTDIYQTPSSLSDAQRSALGVFPLTLVAAPAYNSATQQATDTGQAFINGVWTQTWAVTPLSDAQIAAKVPQHVSTTQAKIALNNAGMTASLNAYLTTATFAQQTAWASSNTFDRNSPTLQAMATAIGLTSTQLDSLFAAAAAIVV